MSDEPLLAIGQFLPANPRDDLARRRSDISKPHAQVERAFEWHGGRSNGLAGVAGVLIAPIASASLFMGMGFALKAFSGAIIGGLNNPRGCIYGGFILGVLESGVGLWQAQWREIVVFGLIILVLAFRPAGLFGQAAVDKV